MHKQINVYIMKGVKMHCLQIDYHFTNRAIKLLLENVIDETN